MSNAVLNSTPNRGQKMCSFVVDASLVEKRDDGVYTFNSETLDSLREGLTKAGVDYNNHDVRTIHVSEDLTKGQVSFTIAAV